MPKFALGTLQLELDAFSPPIVGKHVCHVWWACRSNPSHPAAGTGNEMSNDRSKGWDIRLNLEMASLYTNTLNETKRLA